MKVFVVIGVWEGLLENVKVFQKRKEAEKNKVETMQSYDKKADWWEDEDPKNKNYSVVVKEREVK